ncbi:MAG TPA: hypothetical protein VLA04_05220 [Verrucomicrobiae bacterium]|nr:hypothetical protein [Verrucomicrobiae bacterium]
MSHSLDRFEVPTYNFASRLYDPEKASHSRPFGKGQDPVFFLEKPLPGFAHALSEEDIVTVLKRVPKEDIAGVKWVMQLQPTKKQEKIESAWATYYWDLNVGRETGEAIALYATNPASVFEWSSSLTPDDRRELERLESEGHTIEHHARGYRIHIKKEAVRNTQRRSLLHEIGHHVDRKRGVARFEAGSSMEKELFADRYAARYLDSLR